VSLTRSVLPQLLNELWALDRPLTLVLDDYHLIRDPDCQETLRFLLRRLPPAMRVVVATRADPPLELGTLRAQGNLAEVRADGLRFSDGEAATFLTERLGLALTSAEVDQLVERTEGWAAGLYLGALSLRNRPDPGAFIAEFAGDNRHLVAYLGGEVLERLPAAQRAFLLQTSVLERLSAALCDAVTGGTDAAGRLAELEQTNLFVRALDARGQWYRYHHLFRELLLLELQRTQPALVAELHGRAAAWYRSAGDALAAMPHALAAQDYQMAGDLFFEYAQPLSQAGHLATVADWMDALPEPVVTARPPLAIAVAWIAGNVRRPQDEVERWLVTAEGSDYEGPFFLGERSLRGAVSLVRAAFPFDDVGRALSAAQIAAEVNTDSYTLSYLIARASLGQCLYLAGRPEEARAVLEEALRAPLANRQSAGVIKAMADLALVSLALGDFERAVDLAHRAVKLRDEKSLTFLPHVWLSSLALSAVLAQHSRFEQAESELASGVEPHLPVLRAWPIPYARALLGLAPVRYARGHVGAAHALLAEARTVLAACPDPGMLAPLLAGSERRLQRLPRRRTGLREELTEAELRILRLLASDLSQREIGRELYLSVNTVKSHTRTIFAKLEANSRPAALSRARALALL
jgi:LuxR family maltose regulon positive regulatory protein